MPGSSETATASFRAGNLAAGTHTANIFLESNDPANPSITAKLLTSDDTFD